jgi:uncharacterized protein (DUF433 family)
METPQPAYAGRIIVDPDVMVGKPVVKGTRITVEAVLELLAGTLDINELYEAFPRLTPEDVKACLSYAYSVIAGEKVDVIDTSLLSASAS